MITTRRLFLKLFGAFLSIPVFGVSKEIHGNAMIERKPIEQSANLPGLNIPLSIPMQVGSSKRDKSREYKQYVPVIMSFN